MSNELPILVVGTDCKPPSLFDHQGAITTCITNAKMRLSGCT